MARKLKLNINAKTLKQGAMVAGVVGAGAIAAKVGGRLAMRASSSVASFAAKSSTNKAVVEAGAGLAIDVVGLLIAGKVMGAAKAAKAAPFVVGGTVMAAAAPLVADKAIEAIDGTLGRFLPGTATVPTPAGFYGSSFSGIAGELPSPGGLWAEPSQGLAGELPSPGGMYRASYGNGATIPGEL